MFPEPRQHERSPLRLQFTLQYPAPSAASPWHPHLTSAPLETNGRRGGLPAAEHWALDPSLQKDNRGFPSLLPYCWMRHGRPRPVLPLEPVIRPLTSRDSPSRVPEPPSALVCPISCLAARPPRG